MKAVTYWSGNPIPYPMFERWHDSFHSKGFETVILSESDAKQHPLYTQTALFAASAPTANGAGFDYQCWVRWCAYALAAPALFTDMDVINYSLLPDQVQTGEFVHIGGAVVYATPEGINKLIARFPTTTPEIYKGKPHVSDIIAVHELAGWGSCEICELAGRPNELVAPMVHFANGYVKPEWRFSERWRAMDDLATRRTQKRLDNPPASS